MPVAAPSAIWRRTRQAKGGAPAPAWRRSTPWSDPRPQYSCKMAGGSSETPSSITMFGCRSSVMRATSANNASASAAWSRASSDAPRNTFTATSVDSHVPW